MWIGDVHDHEDLRASELAETDCLQLSLRSRPVVSWLLHALQPGAVVRSAVANVGRDDNLDPTGLR
jgi:hypothetical protein